MLSLVPLGVWGPHVLLIFVVASSVLNVKFVATTIYLQLQRIPLHNGLCEKINRLWYIYNVDTLIKFTSMGHTARCFTKEHELHKSIKLQFCSLNNSR